MFIKLFRFFTGYYKLFLCTKCHMYSRKGQLKDKACPNCNGKVGRVL